MTDIIDRDEPRRRDPLDSDQRRVAASFADLQRLLGKGPRRIGTGRVPILTPAVRDGHLHFDRPLPEAAAEVILFDRTGRSVSVVLNVCEKKVIRGHPLAVRFTVNGASNQLLARGDIPTSGHRPPPCTDETSDETPAGDTAAPQSQPTAAGKTETQPSTAGEAEPRPAAAKAPAVTSTPSRRSPKPQQK
ncbi:hypothetical protein [Actinomadura sp. SCN-SB]|uniref:hypothetical protein n=1 Tax=Actinomadura sp. SCN-SB TaxID=3373092 RepID=UPI0037518966